MKYRRITYVAAALTVVLLYGTAGYVLIERWHLLDALYMTVITIASVGFMEVQPLSPAGRIFTMFLILGGMGVLAYGVSSLTAFIVDGQLSDALRKRTMQKRIDRLREHFVVCGIGRTGMVIIDELRKTHQPFVVVDKDPDRARELEREEIPVVIGDATQEAVLRQAGIERAVGLISAVDTDAENLLVTLTAKGLNPRVRIIAKASAAESEGKLRRAGADGVVLPSFIGGMRMASELIRPSVVTFLDDMLRANDPTVRLENVVLDAASPAAGKTLGDVGLLAFSGVSLVALRAPEASHSTFNPPASTRLTAGTVLIVMGDVTRIAALKQQLRT